MGRWRKESCIRVSNIPFAKEKAEVGKWVLRDGKLININELQTVTEHYHYVISDEIDVKEWNGDGKNYTSRSKLEKRAKELGLVFTNKEELRNQVERNKRRWKERQVPVIQTMLNVMDRYEQNQDYRDKVRRDRERRNHES